VQLRDCANFTGRGNAYFGKGDHDRAIADYDEATRLDPKDAAYAMLWRYLVREHIGQDGAAELSVNATRLNTTNWPYAVIDFYLGRRSVDEMRAAAANANEQCESEFFAGEWQLLRGNKAEAGASLQVVVDICPKNFVEYPGAISELRRLGQ
jgi:lipoprotein NlpI